MMPDQPKQRHDHGRFMMFEEQSGGLLYFSAMPDTSHSLEV